MHRVYIVKMKLYESNDNFIYKIGKSSDKRSVDRLMEVSRSFFQSYRYTPFCRLLRDRECENGFDIETKLHQHFKSTQYYFDKKFNGNTEFFLCREDELLKVYDELLPVKGKGKINA